MHAHYAEIKYNRKFRMNTFLMIKKVINIDMKTLNDIPG